MLNLRERERDRGESKYVNNKKEKDNFLLTKRNIIYWRGNRHTEREREGEKNKFS